MLKTSLKSLLIVLILFLCACDFSNDGDDDKLPIDPQSNSNPNEIRVTHLDIDLDVDFTSRTLSGYVTLDVERVARNASRLVLDTRALDIDRVEVSDDGISFTEVPFSFGTFDEILGTPLKIEMPDSGVKVRVFYTTSPSASGLGWLDPNQTTDKQSPFLYSQSEMLHGRSWIPMQDTPEVRITYSAAIRTPQDLLALMSALNNPTSVDDGRLLEEQDQREYTFSQPNAIPSYLLALAVGKIAFRATGSLTGVYAEPSVVDRAATEFGDMEQIMSTVESLYGPYRWGRYDLLFLPSSFPYGGMENPMLTFLTPTLLVGDKSLVYVAVHELVHSWSGNLVSNATWSDFWINEGFTVHTELRILEALYGKRMADMERVLGWQDLQAALEAYPPEDQILHIDLEGRDPEQHAMTPIPYEKGNLFLVQVEQVFGRDQFDLFLNGYFDHFGFQSITTKTLEKYLNDNLLAEQPELAKEIPIKEWLYEPGLPSSAPQPYSEALAQVEAHVQAYADGEESASDLPGKQWNAQEWVYFLRSLPALLGIEKMNELDQIFDLTNSPNAEILFQWLLMSIQSDYAEADQALEDFLISVGRLKFVRPLYEELVKTDAGHARALEIYKKARPNYHPITVRVVDEILDYMVLGFVI